MSQCVTYDYVPPLKEIYRTNYIYLGRAIGDRDEECGVLKVGDDVTPIYPKGEGGYEDIKISKCYGRYCCVYE